MNVESKLAKKIIGGDYIVTAEFLVGPDADGSITEDTLKVLGNAPAAINVSDNHYDIAMSSLAGSVAVKESGAEPVYQLITRDRNRIALQSDLIGASYLGIKNMLCLSGYHQKLTSCPESGNSYDIDSTQLIEIATKMGEEGVLSNGAKIDGDFSMLIGAVANPFLKPLELNVLRVDKKIEAGAKFIQTHAVFDIEAFGQWLEALVSDGITEKAAIIAGVLPLESAAEAEKLRDTYTDCYIPDSVIERLKKASADSAEAEKKEGVAICLEMIEKLRNMKGLRGIHILSGGKEKLVPQILSESGLDKIA